MRKYFSIVAFVVVLSATGYSADPSTGLDEAVQPCVLTPFVHSPDLFPILPWDVLARMEATVS